jgi:hypothetical protein
MARNHFLTLSIGPDVMALSMTKKRPTNPPERIFQISFLHKPIVHLCVYGVNIVDLVASSDCMTAFTQMQMGSDQANQLIFNQQDYKTGAF